MKESLWTPRVKGEMKMSLYRLRDIRTNEIICVGDFIYCMRVRAKLNWEICKPIPGELLSEWAARCPEVYVIEKDVK